MTEDNPRKERDETESIHLNSDPIEVARRHSEWGARTGQGLEQIGPYKILSELGAGGMGIVYLAEQVRPIHRRVALKIIKLGMDTRQVIARFETEREALALMNHPNVAKVFDAGATETGRPYFVMEFVQGIPITDYCDMHRLNTEERLRLFMDVCGAVQHAHQKGIIHRDIKPSNVLVTEIDNVPTVKVIDFGIAKATQQRLTEVTFSTQEGQFIGTPAYMSPEQAGAATHDIDTRTDVYSLGVLLYELLVGARPFDDVMLRSAALSEIQRIIREVDPPKPSMRLSGIGALSTTIAENRGTQSRTLARHLRGDLDWIVMKCLEKDRARRYDTVNALVMEIQRFLHNEPIMAGPPSAVYRMRKFVRRNKRSVAAVVAVMVALATGLSVAASMYIRAERARTETAAERDRAIVAEKATNQARNEAEQVTKFLSDMLAAADPEQQGIGVTVREVLDKAADGIGEKFSRQPLIKARLHDVIGATYAALGALELAEHHATEATVIYTRELGPKNSRTLSATNNLASAIVDRGHFGAAEAMQRATLEIQLRVLGEEHQDTLASMNNLANSLDKQGRHAEAEEFNRKSLAIRRRKSGDEHPETLRVMYNLAVSLDLQGRHSEAEDLHRKILEDKRGLFGEEHLETVRSMPSLGQSLWYHRRYAEAEELFRKTLELQRRLLGDEHPETLQSFDNLATIIGDQGRHVEAEALHRKILETKCRVLGDEHPGTLTAMSGLAVSLGQQGRHSEAEELDRKTLVIRSRVLGEEHSETLRSMNNLANRIHAQGRSAEAQELYCNTLEIQRRALGDKHPDVAATLYNLAGVLEEDANLTEGLQRCREAEEIATSRLPPGHVLRKRINNRLGGILSELGQYPEAEPLLVESYEALRNDPSLPPSDKKEMVERLVRLYDCWDAAEPGNGYVEKAAEWRAKYEEPSSN